MRPSTRFGLLLLAALPLLGAALARAQGALTDASPNARRALVVGAAAYQTLPALSHTSLDATNVDEFLRFRLRFPAGNVTTLANIAPYKSPTHANLAIEGERLVAAASANDAVIVYFSGHGVRYRDEDYLLPVDAVSAAPEDAPDNGIALGDLLRRLEAKNPRSVLALIDGSRKYRGLGVPAALRVGPRTTVLYAAGPAELSQDGKPEDFNLGVFTRFVLTALNPNEENAANARGEVTFQGLRAFVQRQVGAYTSDAYGAKQTPDGLSANPGSTLIKFQ